MLHDPHCGDDLVAIFLAELRACRPCAAAATAWTCPAACGGLRLCATCPIRGGDGDRYIGFAGLVGDVGAARALARQFAARLPS